jgi:hypothetical protein
MCAINGTYLTNTGCTSTINYCIFSFHFTNILLYTQIAKKHRNLIKHQRDAGGKDFYYSQDASENRETLTILI